MDKGKAKDGRNADEILLRIPAEPISEIQRKPCWWNHLQTIMTLHVKMNKNI